MKKIILLFVLFLAGKLIFAESGTPAFDWSLLWSGSWENVPFSLDRGTFYNRGEIKINMLELGFLIRAQILDRHKPVFEFEPFGFDAGDGTTNFTGGLYHRDTGSRLLFGVLDEWGLPARIRNPWIRSPPYAENHKPIMSDIKTTASTTKNDEVYLYLSTPYLNISNMGLRGFFSAQTETENFEPAFSGGIDLRINRKTGLLLEGFYTRNTLSRTKVNTWFSDPPVLPERDFRLYAAGLRFNSPNFSLSSDFAFSETFAWGTDIYCNLGLRFSKDQFSLSLAADGAGERFVFRDGSANNEGFRSAAKIEVKGRGNSLFRVNTVLRSPEFGEEFTRSSSGIYYRAPAVRRDIPPFRLTRLSLTADRNANNLKKISDKLSGTLAFAVRMPQNLNMGSLGINISGSVNGLTETERLVSPYPIPENFWEFDEARASIEFIVPLSNLQLRTRAGYTNYSRKDNTWDFSLSTSMRFNNGRLSLKAETPDFPERWTWTISWRIEK